MIPIEFSWVSHSPHGLDILWCYTHITNSLDFSSYFQLEEVQEMLMQCGASHNYLYYAGWIIFHAYVLSAVWGMV